MANKGVIGKIFPPGSNGQSRGAGMLDGDTGSNLVFQTPGDNNNEILSVGQQVTYEVDAHGQILSVSAYADAPIGGV